MRDYSIENAHEKIHYTKTKEYFNEVVKSYYNGSYRSSVVILYSIVITDILLKLDDLKDLHSDVEAKKILGKINEIKKDKPTSAEWERKLIEWVGLNTNLLDNSELLNLRTLQQYRHLCSHPVLTSGFDLFEPNKETTRALIVNSLSGVLTKPPLLSSSIIEDILYDISRSKNLEYDEEELQKHLQSKYLNKTTLKTELRIIKTLWKLVFKLDNDDCSLNRNINLMALKVILSNKFKEYKESISQEVDSYSDFNQKFIKEILVLLNSFPELYKVLSESSQILIKKHLESDADLETLAWFVIGDIEKHINKVLEYQDDYDREYQTSWISNQTINEIYNIAREFVSKKFANSFIINMYGHSNNYNVADIRYDGLISPNIENFDKENLSLLVKVIDENGQIHSRRASKRTNREIKEYIDKTYGENTFNYAKYTNFYYTLNS